jgi:hypothetical protein
LGSLRACWTGCTLRAFSAVGPGDSCSALGTRQALGAWSARRTSRVACRAGCALGARPALRAGRPSGAGRSCQTRPSGRTKRSRRIRSYPVPAGSRTHGGARWGADGQKRCVLAVLRSGGQIVVGEQRAPANRTGNDEHGDQCAVGACVQHVRTSCYFTVWVDQRPLACRLKLGNKFVSQLGIEVPHRLDVQDL